MNNAIAQPKAAVTLTTVALLCMVSSCSDSHRWIQKAELPIPSSDSETCTRDAVSSISGASIVGVEYGRFELRVRFKKTLANVRVYIQPKDNDTADLMFVGNDWSEPQDAKDEFASFSKLMSDAVLHYCGKIAGEI